MEQDKSTYIKSKIDELLGLTIDDTRADQLAEFYEMIIEKNKVMNLTAITDFEEFVVKHFVDSLSIIKISGIKECFQKPVNVTGDIVNSDTEINIIDIGTGAGFPGVPLKIVFPDLNVTLFDSLQKRLTFLDEVIDKLKLKNIKTVHGRAEEFGRKLDYREKYDIVVSRAVAELTPLCELALPFCMVGGRFISYKGGKGSEELKNAEYAIKELGGKKGTICEYTFDTNDATNERTLIEICKVKNTSSKYPRGGGKPFKAPLHMV